LYTIRTFFPPIDLEIKDMSTSEKEDQGSSSASSVSSSSSSSTSSKDEDDNENDSTSKVSDQDSDAGPNAVTTTQYEGAKEGGFTRRSHDHEETPGVRRQKRSYSDSDNSFEPGQEKKMYEDVHTVNWDDHTDQVWGRRPLFHSLDTHEIDSLVGLANTYASQEMNLPPTRAKAFPEDQRQDPCPPHPLIGLDSSPLPLSFLNHIVERASKAPAIPEKLFEKFGTSALVAIGMALEETLTASLLPLAGLHVLRCRELENDTSVENEYEGPTPPCCEPHPITGKAIRYDTSNVDKTESPFQEWTLPPEEAMMKLLQQEMVPTKYIPFVLDPTRSTATGSISSEQSIRNWCQAQQLDPDTVGKNKELFRLFLSVDSPIFDLKVVEKEEKKKPKSRELAAKKPKSRELAATTKLAAGKPEHPSVVRKRRLRRELVARRKIEDAKTGQPSYQALRKRRKKLELAATRELEAAKKFSK
jgi:hypothetical protein